MWPPSLPPLTDEWVTICEKRYPKGGQLATISGPIFGTRDRFFGEKANPRRATADAPIYQYPRLWLPVAELTRYQRTHLVRGHRLAGYVTAASALNPPAARHFSRKPLPDGRTLILITTIPKGRGSPYF